MITRIGANTDGAVGHLLGDFINPVFAYSLNRKLRNFYTGEYFRFKDKNGEGDYPSTTPDMSEDVELLKIYDQKAKFGYNQEDAIAQGSPKLRHEDGFYKAVFSGSEYMSIGSADAFGGHFNIILVGKGDYPRPAFGMWGENDTVTIEPSTEAVPKFTVNRNRGAMRSPQMQHEANPDIELPTEPNNGNDYVFPAGEKLLVVALRSEQGITQDSLYRLRRMNVSNNNGQLENLDGTVVGWVGERGKRWQTVTEKNPFSPHSYSCFYGFDPAHQDRVMSFNSDGHNVEADTTESFSDIAIGRMQERYYIVEVLELVGYVEDLKLKWHDTLHSQIQTVYQTYR